MTSTLTTAYLPAAGIDIPQFIELSPIAILLLDAEGNLTQANKAFFTFMRDSVPDGEPLPFLSLIDPEDRAVFTEAHGQLLKGNAVKPISLSLKPEAGDPVFAYTYLTQMQGVRGEPVTVLHMVDQTEQKNLEHRFAHSQKMQAVGQLAGGVAHDFNNLLTAMIGFSDLLLMRHQAGDPSFADIMQIKQNANRAANLVRQLLAFSRRQTLQPKTIDLTEVLAELSNLIRRLIGENIQMNLQHGRGLGMVKADQGQLEQVIINLAVNARDAMKDGGSLTIRSSNVTIDSPESLPQDKRREFNLASTNPFSSLSRLRQLKGVETLMWIMGLSILAQFCLHTCWFLYTEFKFGWTPRDNGLSLLAVGGMAVLVQGGLLRQFQKHIALHKLVIMGLISSTIAFALYGAVPAGWMIFVVVVANVFGYMVQPGLQSLVANSVDPTRQGESMGAVSSINSVAAVLGPVLGTPLLALVSDYPQGDWRVGAPFYLCAAIQGVAAIIGVRYFTQSRNVPTAEFKST